MIHKYKICLDFILKLFKNINYYTDNQYYIYNKTMLFCLEIWTDFFIRESINQFILKQIANRRKIAH